MTKRHRVAILGAGGHARELEWYVRACGHECVAFVIRDTNAVGPLDGPASMLRDEAWLTANRDAVDAFALGIGTPRARLRLAALGRELHPSAVWPTLIHPSVQGDTSSMTLGEGVTVGAGAVLTVNVVLGDYALVNFAATVGHETTVGRGSVINPGANVSGGVTIGEGVLVGAGAVILQYLTIGAGAIVGAGAVVTKDVPPGATVVGVPARRRATPA